MSTTIRSTRPPGRTIESELQAPRYGLTNEVDLSDLPEQWFAAAVLRDGLPHVSAMNWASSAKRLGSLRERALATVTEQGLGVALLRLDDDLGEPCLLYVHLRDGSLYARAAAFGLDALSRAEAWLRERLPEAVPQEDYSVPVRFWTEGNPARMISRTLVMPPWPGISANYAGPTRGDLEGLLAPEFRPASAGQLILWHGPPGTGKTHALRALAWEWREWCELHYVTDPETFFGAAPYMLHVLLREAENDYEDDEPRRRWRLLVLEDTGELLTADAKERTGQGLSRLLNVVDGVIGQGLRVLVLVTTNERLRSLHPAVSRPGRCAATVEFGAFGGEEAARWLASHGSDARPERATLAELYSCLAGKPAPHGRRVGFAPS